MRIRNFFIGIIVGIGIVALIAGIVLLLMYLVEIWGEDAVMLGFMATTLVIASGFGFGILLD